MRYKSITLELLQQHRKMYDRLISNGKILPALDQYATELKESHQGWMEALTQARPGSAQSQIASEALEIALKELEDHLASESAPEESETFNIDAALAFIISHTPRA